MSLKAPLNVLLWWDTGIAMGQNNSYFFVGSAKRTIMLSWRISYERFLDQIYQLMGVSNTDYQLKLTLLYPICYGSRSVNVLMDINSNEDMKIMYNLQRSYSGFSTIQVYVQKLEIRSTNVGMEKLQEFSQVLEPQTICHSFDLNIPYTNTTNEYLNQFETARSVQEIGEPSNITGCANDVNGSQGYPVHCDAMTEPVDAERQQGDSRAVEVEEDRETSSNIESINGESNWEDNRSNLNILPTVPSSTMNTSNVANPNPNPSQAFLMDPSQPLLTLQGNCWSHFATTKCIDRVLKCRRYDQYFRGTVLFHPRVQAYIFRAGFEGIYRACNHLGWYLRCDEALITAFVERWQQKMHSFWLPFGEVSITLQDVEIIWGLRVDGRPVVAHAPSRTTEQWQETCHELLGFMPLKGEIHRNRLMFSALVGALDVEIPSDAPEETYLCIARIWLLLIFGGLLFTEKSDYTVNPSFLELLRDLDVVAEYSWGSAVLACLYRNLCASSRKKACDIAGPTLLLQLWVWERFQTLRPSCSLGDGLPPVPPHCPLAARWRTTSIRSYRTKNVLRGYRDSLDALHISHYEWMPYTQYFATLPAFCTAGHMIWRSRVPLLFYYIMEFHLPDRVLRQFGQFQVIPEIPDTIHILHSATSLSCRDWTLARVQYLKMWELRHQHIVGSYAIDDVSMPNPDTH